jgi:hypothetical protein
VECNKLAVDIDNEVVNVYNFIRDKHKLKFPELESLVRGGLWAPLPCHPHLANPHRSAGPAPAAQEARRCSASAGLGRCSTGASLVCPQGTCPCRPCQHSLAPHPAPPPHACLPALQVQHPLDYARVVQRIGNEMDLTLVDLEDLLPAASVMVVTVGALGGGVYAGGRWCVGWIGGKEGGGEGAACSLHTPACLQPGLVRSAGPGLQVVYHGGIVPVADSRRLPSARAVCR